MPNYYYHIKSKNAEGYWAWPPIFCGQVEGVDKMDARKKLEELYGVHLPMGAPKKNADKQDLLLHLEDMTNKKYLQDRFMDRVCNVCGRTYTENEKYLLGVGGYASHCSKECTDNYKYEEAIDNDVNFDFNGIHDAVIYKITCKTTGKCYIGKTTQAFTLRWYQHFYQSANTKFHKAIKEHGICEWTFEVIERIDIPKNVRGGDKEKVITERETYWMGVYDSVNNGYNTMISQRLADIPDELPSLFQNEENK